MRSWRKQWSVFPRTERIAFRNKRCSRLKTNANQSFPPSRSIAFRTFVFDVFPRILETLCSIHLGRARTRNEIGIAKLLISSDAQNVRRDGLFKGEKRITVTVRSTVEEKKKYRNIILEASPNLFYRRYPRGTLCAVAPASPLRYMTLRPSGLM